MDQLNPSSYSLVKAFQFLVDHLSDSVLNTRLSFLMVVILHSVSKFIIHNLYLQSYFSEVEIFLLLVHQLRILFDLMQLIQLCWTFLSFEVINYFSKFLKKL